MRKTGYVLRAMLLSVGLGILNARAGLILMGPNYPAPGGNTLSTAGNSSVAGGLTLTYGINNPAQYAALYSGPWNIYNAIWISLISGTQTPLAFSTASGNQATWLANSLVPVEFKVTVMGLGNNPFVTGASVGRPDVPILWNATSVSTYSVNLQWNVFENNQWVPLDNYPNTVYGGNSSFGFYSAVPEPSAFSLGCLGSLALLPFFRRRLEQRGWKNSHCT